MSPAISSCQHEQTIGQFLSSIGNDERYLPISDLNPIYQSGLHCSQEFIIRIKEYVSLGYNSKNGKRRSINTYDYIVDLTHALAKLFSNQVKILFILLKYKLVKYRCIIETHVFPKQFSTIEGVRAGTSHHQNPRPVLGTVFGGPVFFSVIFSALFYAHPPFLFLINRSANFSYTYFLNCNFLPEPFF